MANGSIVLTEHVTQPPGCCLLCAGNPVDETKEDHPLLPFIHVPGLDVNWGDSVYICWNCASVMADLLGRPDSEKVKAILRGAKLQKKANGKLVKEVDELKKLLASVIAGETATEKAKEVLDAGGN
jgi:hypothetical protein